MIFEGKVYKDGKFWLAEAPALDAMTQGRTRKEALAMLESLISEMVDSPTFRVKVVESEEGELAIGTNEIAAVIAVMLKRLRVKRGLSLRDMAESLGSTSPNAYAAYESGAREPSITKMEKLLRALGKEKPIRLKVG